MVLTRWEVNARDLKWLGSLGYAVFGPRTTQEFFHRTGTLSRLRLRLKMSRTTSQSWNPLSSLELMLSGLVAFLAFFKSSLQYITSPVVVDTVGFEEDSLTHEHSDRLAKTKESSDCQHMASKNAANKKSSCFKTIANLYLIKTAILGFISIDRFYKVFKKKIPD